MKEIGISDFEKLVMERLTNPRNFTGRSLVLWNAAYMDYGIAQRVIKQCCERYNKENPNDQVWFRKSDMTFYSDDYSQPQTWCSSRRMHWNKYLNKEVFGDYDELKRCGIIFNTGCYRIELQEDWLKFVNTHTNHSGGVFQDCAVIVCAHTDDSDYMGPSNPAFILKEEQYGENCDIYHIQPTIDEWAKWVEPFYDSDIIKVVCAYIEKNGVVWHFDYWLRIMDALEKLKNVKEYKDCSLCQIPEEEVNHAVYGTATLNHPAPDFCNFIHSFYKDFPKNE